MHVLLKGTYWRPHRLHHPGAGGACWLFHKLKTSFIIRSSWAVARVHMPVLCNALVSQYFLKVRYDKDRTIVTLDASRVKDRGGHSRRKLLDNPGTRLLSASRNPSKILQTCHHFDRFFSCRITLVQLYIFDCVKWAPESKYVWKFSITFFESYNSWLPAVAAWRLSRWL